MYEVRRHEVIPEDIDGPLGLNDAASGGGGAAERRGDRRVVHQHMHAPVGKVCEHRMRQHMSACVSIRQHTSEAYASDASVAGESAIVYEASYNSLRPHVLVAEGLIR